MPPTRPTDDDIEAVGHLAHAIVRPLLPVFAEHEAAYRTTVSNCAKFDAAVAVLNTTDALYDGHGNMVDRSEVKELRKAAISWLTKQFS